MFASISTKFACTENELWQQIRKPKSLQFVASPILSFIPVELGVLDDEWEVGQNYRLKLYFLKLVPLGHHTIHLTKIDRDENAISSRETGLLARVWNHNIFFKEIAPKLVSYTDEIEIQAGWLTPFIWMFAHVFYRHRQRRWKVLLKQENEAKYRANKGMQANADKLRG